jgi:hypothetical protein
VLSFEVLSLIATDEKGMQDGAKMKALRRLFQPDARNELPLLAFVQVSQSPAKMSVSVLYAKLLFTYRAVIRCTSIFDTLRPL